MNNSFYNIKKPYNKPEIVSSNQKVPNNMIDKKSNPTKKKSSDLPKKLIT